MGPQDTKFNPCLLFEQLKGPPFPPGGPPRYSGEVLECNRQNQCQRHPPVVQKQRGLCGHSLHQVSVINKYGMVN